VKDWFTAKELTRAQLPGVPREKSPLIRFAKRNEWKSREVPGAGLRGGARIEYHISSLSEAQQTALIEYLAREQKPLPAVVVDSDSRDSAAGAIPATDIGGAAGAIVTATPEETAQIAAGTLDEREVRRRWYWKQFECKSAARQKEARRRAAAAAKALELIKSGCAKMESYQAAAQEHSFSAAAVRGFVADVDGFDRADFAAVLIDQRCGRPRESSYSSRIDDLFRSDFLRRERPSAPSCYDRIKPVAQREGLELPSLATIMRHLRRDLTWQAIVEAREGRKALEATYPAQERDRSVFRAMQALCADGYVFLSYVKWPDGVIARPCMVWWIDLFSGYPLAWRIDRTENLDLVRLSFGDVIEQFGIPDELYLDNGRGFAAHWMSGRIKHRFRFKLSEEEPAGIFSLLNIRVHWSIPGHPQSKVIERAHREMHDRIDKHPKLAGAMARDDAVPLELFVAVLDAEMEAIRQRPGRRARNCGGKSFWEVFSESYSEGPIRKATEAQRRLCLLAAQSVTVSARDGTVRLADNRYFSEEIAALAGEKVTIRFDPQRLHDLLYIYRVTGEYVGAAQCVAPVGFNDSQAARTHARLKRANLKFHRAILENERRMGVRDLTPLLPAPPSSPDALRSKVVKLFHAPIETPPAEAPAPDIREQRRAAYERLKRIPPNERSKQQEALVRMYERYGPNFPQIGAAG
jgi:putative transposase